MAKGKRKYTKKQRKNYNTMVLGQTPSLPLGNSFKWRTRYVSFNNINPTIGGIMSTHVFSLNGLYDPDITSTGKQPIGFDQMMTMYNHYTVLGAKAKVTFTNTDTSYSQICLLQVKDSDSNSLNYQQQIENGLTNYKVAGVAGSGAEIVTLHQKVGMSRFFGKIVATEHDYRGTTSNNPSEQVYLHVSVVPNASVDSAAVACTVEIDYIALLHEPKELLRS